MASFLAELKRRNVVKVGAAYAAVAWLLAQIAATVFPAFNLSNEILRALLIVIGLGFPITIVLAWIYDLTPKGIQRTDDMPDTGGASRISGRGLDFTIIGCLIVTVFILVFERYVWDPTATQPVASIAVLPFAQEPKTGDGETDITYLSEGIADSLVMRLSRIPSLKVKSRSLIRDANEDARTIGQALGVDAICLGRIVHRGDVLEITVELVDTSDGSVMWSDRFQRNHTSVLGIESEVSAEIARILSLKLSIEDATVLARAPTDNPAAYRLYLQGRYFWNQRSADGLRASADYYRRAIDLDPDYSLAWAGLADAYLMLFGWGIEPPNEVAPLVLAAANRAIELDPTLANPHATLGYLKTIVERDWDGARNEFLRAIDLNDNYSTAHHWYAFYLSTLGDGKGAIEQILKARDSEPLSPIINAEVGLFYIYDRQYDLALKELNAAALISPNFPPILNELTRTYALMGRQSEAIEMHESWRRVVSGEVFAKGFANVVLPKLGLHDEAKSFFELVVEVSRTEYVMPGLLGMLAASIGETDVAFKYFDVALEERSMVVSWLRDPLLDEIQDDPRLRELFATEGLEL